MNYSIQNSIFLFKKKFKKINIKIRFIKTQEQLKKKSKEFKKTLKELKTESTFLKIRFEEGINEKQRIGDAIH